jgi:hypothetical protein
MSRIERIRSTVQARKAARAQADRSEETSGNAADNLPVPVAPVVTVRSFREERRRAEAELAAQLIGQDGQRRGLRAGPHMVDVARAAYNRVEWSGSYDRRARKGRQARADI